MNLLSEGSKLLVALTPCIAAEGAIPSAAQLQLAIRLFGTFTETMQGPCFDNQFQLASSKMLIGAASILQFCGRSPEQRPEVELELVEQLTGACLDMLQSLLEGPQENQQEICQVLSDCLTACLADSLSGWCRLRLLVSAACSCDPVCGQWRCHSSTASDSCVVGR